MRFLVHVYETRYATTYVDAENEDVALELFEHGGIPEADWVYVGEELEIEEAHHA